MSQLVNFDVLDSAFMANPYPTYQRLHQDDLILFDRTMQAYFVGKYDDVNHILRCSDFTTAPLAERAQPVMGDRVLAQMEGSEHAQKRKAVLRGLSGRYFQNQHGPLIESISRALLTPFLNQGKMDLVNDFGKDYAVLVTLGLLGLPTENHRQIAAWHKGVADFITRLDLTDEERMYSLACSDQLSSLLKPIVAYRNRHPGDDLISLLCQVGHESGGMTTNEIIALCLNILLAATEPADKTLAMLFKHLLDDPARFAEVKDDRKLLREAIDETLRLTSPVQLIPREASIDSVISGVTIPKGAMVFNMIGAANRDPKVFVDPEQFHLHRRRDAKNDKLKKRHLAFGTGPHVCLGAEFSLRQIEITANVLFDSLPNLRFAKGFQFSEHGLYTRGPDSLQLVFDHSDVPLPVSGTLKHSDLDEVRA